MICCLLNLIPSCFALRCSHKIISASVGNFLFFLAKSFSNVYLSGDAVLYLPLLLPIL